MKDKISASEKPKSCPSQAISEQEGDKKISQLAVTSLVFLCATIPSYGLFYYSFCFYYPQPVSDSIALLFGLLPALAFLTGVTSLGIICVQHKVLKGAPYAIIAVTLSLIPLVQTWEPWQEQRRLAKIPLLEDGFDNLLILGETLLDYAADNDGYLPTAEEWCDRLMQHNPSLTRGNFLHPSAEILTYVSQLGSWFSYPLV